MKKVSDSVELIKKINEYPSATTPVAGTELIEVWQNGATKQMPINQLPSGGGGGGAGGMFEVTVQFSVPSTTWVYNHNLGKIPLIRVFDHGVVPTEYFTEIIHSEDKMTSTIVMASEMSGYIVVNY